MVSVIIPTHNRPHLVKQAVRSVLNQTFQDFEIIVVDDGLKDRADKVIKEINNNRIKYIQHKQNRGGSAARNTGIKNAHGEFVAFLDDDDEWLPDKLEIQMAAFKNTPPDVGFCFSSAYDIYNEEMKKAILRGEARSRVARQEIKDYYDYCLKSFKQCLTVTLIVKRGVFDEVGYFDEKFPSHQEADLMIRISKKFKGLKIDLPLVCVNMSADHEQVGKNLNKRIAGREMILEKYRQEYKKRPIVLAKHIFELGLFYRDNKRYSEAQKKFRKAMKTEFKLLYFLHWLSMIFNGKLYGLMKKD